MRERQSRRLSDIIAIKHGFAFPGKDFSEDPTLPTLLTPGNFAIGGGFKEAKPKTFAGDYPQEYELSPGDLIVTMTDLSKQGDTLGLPALVPDRGRYLHNQRIGLVEVRDERVVDKSFLSYYLRTDAYRVFILGTASGSTVKHTSPSKIGSFVADLPSLSEQRAFAEVLGALDDKIAANTNLINTADELSHAIYRTMADGSSPIRLSDTAQFINGKAFTKGASGTGRVVVRIAELNSGIGDSTVYSDIDVPDQYVARPGDLLFAWSGSLTLHRWFREEAIVNQHIFKVIPNAGYPMWLVYELVRQKLDEFKAIAADKATTMGHIQRKHLDAPVVSPAQSTIDDNNELMTALWEQGLAAQEEILNLEATRNALLPHLMSGRLGIKQAGKLKSQWLDNDRRIASHASRFQAESLTT